MDYVWPWNINLIVFLSVDYLEEIRHKIICNCDGAYLSDLLMRDQKTCLASCIVLILNTIIGDRTGLAGLLLVIILMTIYIKVLLSLHLLFYVEVGFSLLSSSITKCTICNLINPVC